MHVNKYNNHKKIFQIISLFVLFVSYLPVANGEINMEIKSPAFKSGEMMLPKHTCDDGNFSPPLSWSGIPKEAKSLALICDDPDAPMGTWVHWVIYNMPPLSKGLQEGVLPVESFAHDTKQGITDFKTIGYGGPCPPSGVHRYFFKLYALDSKLNLPGGATKKELLAAMKGHILAQAEMIGKYEKRK